DHAVRAARYERPGVGQRGAMIAALPPLLPVPPDGDPGEIEERTLYFHKNGNSSAALEQSWDNFPRSLRAALCEVAHAMRDNLDQAFVLRIAEAVDQYIAGSEPDRILLPFCDFMLA